MKVAIEKAFPIAAAPEATWAVLGDVEAVAACMPGAKITERVDAMHYKGMVTVKVGPATLSFRGEIEVAGRDAAARSLHLIAKGTDTTGSSAASMDLAASVEADGAASRLKGVCETSMSGKAAAFGGRLMNSVADQVLEQFAKNFAARVAAASPPASGGDASASASASATAAPRASEPAAQLDGVALAWGAFRRWLRDLFANKPA